MQGGRSSDPIPYLHLLHRRYTSSRTLLLNRPKVRVRVRDRVRVRVRVSFISTVAAAVAAARVIATMLPVTAVSLLGPRAAS